MPTRTSPTPPSMPAARPSSRSRRGFALILTVTLLGLLLLVLIALATFTRIETRVAGLSQSQAEARQNALLGINQAVGRLQQVAGPDQRITARADINSANTGNPYWTGVWNAENTADVDFPVWLVNPGRAGSAYANEDPSDPRASGPRGGTFSPSTSLIVDDQRDGDDADYPGIVRLVGPETVGATAALNDLYIDLYRTPITAREIPGAVPTDDITIGHFAWWVGDLGIKASINSTDRTGGSGTAGGGGVNYDDSPGTNYAGDASNPADTGGQNRNRLRSILLQNQRGDLALQTFSGSPALSSAVAEAIADAAPLASITLPTQAAFLAATTTDIGNAVSRINAAYHDVGTFSTGVLASTQGAGLKVDLDAVNLAGTNFPAASRLNDPANDWMKGLVEFKGIRASNGTNALTSQIGVRPPFSGTSDGAVRVVAPVLSELQLDATFNVDNITGGPLTCDYTLNVEFWNPFNTTIPAQTFSVRFPKGSAAGGFPNIINYGDTQGNDVQINLYRTLLNDPTVDASDILEFQFAVPDLAPGQVYATSTSGAGLLARDSTSSPNRDEGNVTHSALGPADPAGAYVVLDLNSADLLIQLVSGFGAGGDIVATYRDIAFDGGAEAASRDIRYYYRLRDESDFGSTTDWIDAFDPRGPEITGGTSSLPSVDRPFTIPDPDPTTAPGNSNAQVNANAAQVLLPANRVILFDVPRMEVLSVGHLAHAPFGRLGTTRNAPAFGIGRRVDSGDVDLTAGGTQRSTGFDIRNSVFDRLFFSGIPRAATPDPYSGAPFANGNLVPYAADPASPPTIPNLRATGENSSRLLLVRNAFNINSTSVAAWRAILGGMRSPIDPATSAQRPWNYQAGAAADTVAELNNAFFRFPHTSPHLSDTYANLLTALGASSAPNDPGQWQLGVRELSNAEIDLLAQAVVSRIKLAQGSKGANEPFTSLRQFVDSGILEDAIADVSSINTIGAYTLPRLAPSRISQVDILNLIAPIIQARSDTFLVRAYGDVTNPTADPDGDGNAGGPVIGRAWCEAVVQRLPTKVGNINGTAGYPDVDSDGNVDPEDEALGTLNSPLTSTSPDFGRRFRVVYFRWLSPDDI